MNVRPAGREACNCASPYNSILERLDAMEAEILAVQATANSAMGVANAQAGAAASSASAAAASATAAGNAAISAASDASDALTQATAASGYADAASDSATDALTALQNIEGTIASVLASDIGGKVDKLTTAGFYLYMHNGSTQGEVQPVVAPTAATIPIRDSDGRMQAADPASGATDKTLVTANWISQTGAGRPNNVIHDSGNESMDGVKECEYQPTRIKGSSQGSGAGWYKVWESETSTQAIRRATILNVVFREQATSCKLIIGRRTLNQSSIAVLYTNITAGSLIATRDSNGKMTLWANTTRTTAWVEYESNGTSTAEYIFSNAITDDTTYSEPQAADYYWMVTL